MKRVAVLKWRKCHDRPFSSSLRRGLGTVPWAATASVQVLTGDWKVQIFPRNRHVAFNDCKIDFRYFKDLLFKNKMQAVSTDKGN